MLLILGSTQFELTFLCIIWIQNWTKSTERLCTAAAAALSSLWDRNVPQKAPFNPLGLVRMPTLARVKGKSSKHSQPSVIWTPLTHFSCKSGQGNKNKSQQLHPVTQLNILNICGIASKYLEEISDCKENKRNIAPVFAVFTCFMSIPRQAVRLLRPDAAWLLGTFTV